MARLIDADAFTKQYGHYYAEDGAVEGFIGTVGDLIAKQPTIDSQPVRYGQWIECDYQYLDHGEVKTEPGAGWCCSVCHVGFCKMKMTYKQYCAHCGSKMVGGVYDG